MSSRLLWLALSIACALAWAQPMLAQLLSPGPLARPHAHLTGDQQCGKCHAAGRRVADDLCTACHTDIGGAIRSGRGMHGTTWKGKGCPTCHSDHRGVDFSLVRFDKSTFAHDQTGFQLKGAHAGADCAACHKGKWMGVARACGSCHADAHGGRFGTSCAQCHGEKSWAEVRLERFDHTLTRFPLRGAHGRVACEACHGTPHRFQGIQFASCTSCHEDPHRGRFPAECTSCHDESSWRSARLSPGAHPRLSLENGHARVPCAKCHDRGNLKPPSRGSACASCHRQVHEAPFGKTCEPCHSSIRWTGLSEKIRSSAHDKTPFPLHGKHLSVPCNDCHSPELPAAKRFRQLEFDACKDCHADPHSGAFTAHGGGDCGACHTDAGFALATFGIEEHASTAFPLVGRHEAVPCNACHRFEPDQQRLSWQGAGTPCAGCHENPHGDAFAPMMREKGCGGCHSPVGWETPTFDHRAWPLTGAHAGVACARCHAPSPGQPKTERGGHRKAPKECSGCHTDVHAGQFRLTEPRRECAFCHETTSFEIARFDHGRKAGFPLEGKHGALDCQACHAAEKLRTGATAVRYRLGYRRCSDCHGDPHSGSGR